MSDEGSRLSPIEIGTIDAIVSLFETNSPGKYDAIARSAQDRGGLSYGKHQAALVSGSLHRLISQYCSADGAQCADRLRPYLPQMQAEDRALDHDDALVAVLREAAADPVMQRTQDEYFNHHYMGPALREAQACGFVTPLGCAVVYDSFVHGSWEAMKGRASNVAGQPSAQNERQWIAAYLSERRAWLAGHSNALLPRTVYRMDCFLDLIRQDAWDLRLPLTLQLNGFTFTLTAWDLGAHLFDDPVFRAEATGLGIVKARRAVVAEGRDRHVQLLLADLGLLNASSGVDGKFGSGSANAVRSFQLSSGMTGTGEVDAGTYVQLSNSVQRRQSSAQSGDGAFTPLPERERGATGAALNGAGATTAAGGGAAVGSQILEGEESSAPDAQPPASTEAQAPTGVETPPPSGAESVGGHDAIILGLSWSELLPWIGVALLLAALAFFALARRRAY
ncbi:MAG TPA: peptidoglycan-binding protein [Vitreimonas sp.]|uniref:peptidoglycan-binding protein n=1 Tax=Vitreimonas sp. TaxID=3069702 RepID=UPI002D48444A|nr:peptidoglycan-binding protein [Vitreimonas sp.]HYD87872.1 peptidoglycan-binding protein [Vitreimonas sp.]